MATCSDFIISHGFYGSGIEEGLDWTTLMRGLSCGPTHGGWAGLI